MEGLTEEQKQESIDIIKEEKAKAPKKDKGQTKATIEEINEDELDF